MVVGNAVIIFCKSNEDENATKGTIQNAFGTLNRANWPGSTVMSNPIEPFRSF